MPSFDGSLAENFRLPAHPLLLKAGDVHVWRIALVQKPEQLGELWDFLSVDERERAARFHFARDRDSFVVAHGALRTILGLYLKIVPGAVCFQYSSYGKPSLAPGELNGELNFNLSHSHELALLAVTRAREVGVDIEHWREGIADEPLAERFFSEAEVAALRSVPREQQTEAFFNCWTRKEAYIKARGEGLSFPLSQFDVSLVPGAPAALLCTRGEPQEADRWRLESLSPGPGYTGAVIAEGQDWQLTCLDWLV